MYKQTLEYFSGVPIFLAPNSAAKLKNAKLDGRKSDIYKDRKGNRVEAIGLTRDYHIYILASRIASMFGGAPVWDKKARTVSVSLIFQTYPVSTEVPVTICFDGSSPYKIPSDLNPEDIYTVSVEPTEPNGLPLSMVFTHNDGRRVALHLAPDLQHFMKYSDEYDELTDFHIEYIGIACGKNGDRSVFDRVFAHEKIVEIMGDFQQRFGNKNLFIFAYDPAYLVCLNGQFGTVVTGAKIVESIVKGGSNSLFEAMEASLISYFQPEYNFEFKNFPSKRPNWIDGSTYSFNGGVLNIIKISVTLASDNSFNINGRWSFGRFYTKNRLPQKLHSIDIDVCKTGCLT
jgi:hypothetical protein